MREIAAIDALRSVIQLGDCQCHSARQANADEQRQQFNNGKNGCHD